MKNFLDKNFNVDNLILAVVYYICPASIICLITYFGLISLTTPSNISLANLTAYFLTCIMLLVVNLFIQDFDEPCDGIFNTIFSVFLSASGLIVLNLLLAKLTGIISVYLGFSSLPANEQILDYYLTNDGAMFQAIYTVAVAPVCEELCFRKGIMGFFKNKNIGMIVSSIMFGLIHVSTVDLQNLIFLPCYVILGLYLAYDYKVHNNIKRTMSVHILNNIFTFIF